MEMCQSDATKCVVSNVLTQPIDSIVGGWGEAGEEGNEKQDLGAPLTLFIHIMKNFKE